MDFRNININRVFIDNNYNITYKTSKNEIKPLVVRSPLMFMPFGVDALGKNYFINAQLRKSSDTGLNKTLDQFQLFIENIEELFRTTLKKEIKSLLRKNDSYDTIINLKIIKQKKIITEVTKNKEFFNFFNIQKNSYIMCELYIDKLWVYNDIVYYKIKIKKLDVSV